MAEQRGFAEWEGRPVSLQLPSGSREVGILEEVNDWGLVLRHSTNIVWPLGGARAPYADGPTESAMRPVARFFPWNNIDSVRPLEPEEIQGYELF